MTVASTTSWLKLTAVRDRAFGPQRFPKVVIIGVIAVGVVITLINERFISSDNLTNMARASAILGIAALAQTIVLIGGGFDLSLGANAAVTGLVLAELLNAGTGTTGAVLLALVAGCGLGLVNGLIVGVLRINAIIATLGTSSVFYGLVLLWTEGVPVTYPREAMAFFTNKVGGLAFQFLAYVVLMLVVGVVLHKTLFGWRLYSVGSSRVGARASGIAVIRIEVLSYVSAGFLAAVGGVLLAVELGSAYPTAGTNWLLISIAAPIIGGVAVSGGAGTVFGGFLGIALITEIGNGLILSGVSTFARELALGLAILLAMVAQTPYLKIGFGYLRRRARGKSGEGAGLGGIRDDPKEGT